MIGSADPSTDENTKQELQKMFVRYKDVLSISDYDHGGAILILHKIDTGDTKPFEQA